MRARFLAAGLAVAVVGGAVADAQAVVPGWECIPAAAGQAVVSGGTGNAPSCGAGTTPVLAPTYVSADNVATENCQSIPAAPGTC